MNLHPIFFATHGMRLMKSAFPLLAATLLTLLSAADCSAQKRMQYPDQEPIGGILANDKIPKNVLETERGREVVDQLRVLRTSELALGKKHPLLPKVRREIKQTKRMLGAWGKSEEIDGDSPAKELASIIPAMEDQDLRQLVLRLIVRLDDLEKQVAELKKQVAELKKQAKG